MDSTKENTEKEKEDTFCPECGAIIEEEHYENIDEIEICALCHRKMRPKH